MSDTLELKALIRKKLGTGESRLVRRNNMVPAIIYGEGKDPLSVSIETKILKKEMENQGFFSKQFNIVIGDDRHRVLAKDVQIHPVKESLIHVDFLRIGKDTKVTVFVPVQFKNENLCDGLKQGGVINIVRREVELKSPVDSIPEVLEVDLKGLQIGDSIHMSDINISEEVTPVISDRDFTVATIAPPTVMRVEDEKVDDSSSGEQEEKSTAESANSDDKDSSSKEEKKSDK